MSTKGLVVLVPYKSGQDFYEDFYEYEYYDYDYGNEDNEENEEFLETNKDDENDEDDEKFLEAYEDEIAYLPVYVETEDEDLALMSVAYDACQYGYVTFPSSGVTAQEWEDRGYPGTVKNPLLDLPPSYEAFEIPDPGDCFCCASMGDYEVITPEEMIKRLKISKADYIPVYLEDDDHLWEQFNNWCVKFLNYSIFLPKQ